MVNSLYTKKSSFWMWAAFAAILAIGVVMLGAYTRLSDAGLGCPDWPGCYGKLVLPKSQNALQNAQQAFPSIPLVAKKAWTEMVHRYFAGTLGLIILGLAIWATLRRSKSAAQPLLTPWFLVALVIFQAALGMWTVTLKLLPVVVMAHLLGGMTITALLWWLMLDSRKTALPPVHQTASAKPWAVLALLIVFTQIFLGAWTSTNYAALACPTFPLCHGTLFPSLYWHNAFNFFSPIGPNYEGGHLAMNARVTIQMVHRYGAFITAAYLIPFSLALIMMRRFRPLRAAGWAILLLLLAQFSLGVLNIELTLPMWTAVLHNGVAALLLLSIVTVLHKLFASRRGMAI